MPTYEYRCDKCGHEFERDQRITEEPVKKCPSCRAARVRRLISATSFVLKGGGWYSDLYSSGKARSGAGETGQSKGSGEGKGASGSDSAAAKESAPKSAGGSDSKPAAGKSDKPKPAKTAAA